MPNYDSGSESSHAKKKKNGTILGYVEYNFQLFQSKAKLMFQQIR